ncbi:uncharacterized protein LOC127792534 [Diospyros lotus]|uniref:uncharacterized protein LOC127792534 n=1 Tax=Diospyros lotus TaxID=55363 RepID=UPI00225909AE|nr:uncharacterized protein LOC127792534 [Diospyros lotus]
MASKFADDGGNTETDDGTAAIQKKRARRVSFAEITSVHVFDRDEDYETPPEAKPSSDGPESGQPDQGLGFHRESTDGEDSRDSLKDEEAEDDDDELTVRKSFFQPFESPSPGSTIGSSTSNDERNRLSCLWSGTISEIAKRPAISFTSSTTMAIVRCLLL